MLGPGAMYILSHSRLREKPQGKRQHIPLCEVLPDVPLPLWQPWMISSIELPGNHG
jgi:hypothetical protein